MLIQFWQDATSALLFPAQPQSVICGLAKLLQVLFLPQGHKEIPPIPSPLKLDYAALPFCMHDSAQDPLVSALHLQAPHFLAHAFTCLLPSSFDNTYRTLLEGSGRCLCWSRLIFEDKQILSSSRSLPWPRGQHLRPKGTVLLTFYWQLFQLITHQTAFTQ